VPIEIEIEIEIEGLLAKDSNPALDFYRIGRAPDPAVAARKIFPKFTPAPPYAGMTK
jgi:hypothetical protein